MTYASDEDDDRLPDAVLKARVEKMLPNLASAIRQAALQSRILMTTYDSITKVGEGRTNTDSNIIGMLVQYAELHRIDLLIRSVTGDALSRAGEAILTKQKS